jgi:hypothetical protein
MTVEVPAWLILAAASFTLGALAGYYHRHLAHFFSYGEWPSRATLDREAHRRGD